MRRILFTLADDTTATECGGCSMYGYHGYQAGLYECAIWNATDGVRAPECLAAEAAAARMVEIAPEDAAAWVRHADEDDDYTTACGRVGLALRAHAEKAEAKP